MFTDFPLGNTAGPPHDQETQLAIARSALSAAFSITQPGTIIALDHEWPEPWKDEARQLIDDRTPRENVPQYQTDADRVAATERHGEAAAGPVC